MAADFHEYPETSSTDPLGWPGYQELLDRAGAATGGRDSVLTGEGTIAGIRSVVIAFDFRFIGGSMGMAAGTRIADAFERATANSLPVVSLVASGGARMQEGLVSLSQMVHTVAAASRASAAGVPHIAIVRNPTTGGVWSSFVACADVIIGLEGASISLAGKRIRGPQRPSAAEAAGAESASEKLRGGWIDLVLAPEDVPKQVGKILQVLGHQGDRDRAAEMDTPSADVPCALGRTALPISGADAVAAARDSARPRSNQYLAAYFSASFVIAGDRSGGQAAGVTCGFGLRENRTIAFIAQLGQPTTAADLRLCERLLDLAERLRLPVLTLIDTPGVATDDAEEAAGIGTALAQLFWRMASLQVPVTSLVIGEGGSGPALAIANLRNLWMTPDSYFAVIAPESAASILKLEPEDRQRVADWLHLRPQDIYELGLCSGIAPSRKTGRWPGSTGTRIARRLSGLSPKGRGEGASIRSSSGAGLLVRAQPAMKSKSALTRRVRVTTLT